MEWYNTLADYGLFADTKEDDNDLNVVPKLVEKVVTPFLTTFFFTEWDPLSRKQLSPALKLVSLVTDHVDGKADNVQKLLSTVMDRFHDLVNNCSKYALLPQEDASKTHAQWKFCRNRWWRAMKLLKTLLCWKSLISEDVVKQLALSHFKDNLLPLILEELKVEPLDVKVVIPMVKKVRTQLRPWIKNPKEGAYGKLYNAVKKFHGRCKAKGVDSKTLGEIKGLVK